jgi:hypothetical protein
MASPAPVLSVCPKKKALGNAYLEATRELMDLHDQEIKLLAKGGSPKRFDLAIKRGRAQCEVARKRYFGHMRVHGC